MSECVFGWKVKHTGCGCLGSFLSETGETAALLWFPLELASDGGKREGARWGPAYKSESLP